MKKLCAVLVVIMLLSLLSACYFPSKQNSVYHNDRQDLLVLFEYTVPFVVESADDPVGDVEIYAVEEDDYGRTLGVMQFNSEHDNALFGENRVYCVLQQGGTSESCFYEDICCVMVENGDDPGAAIELLKQNNGWDLPLQMGKCIRIPFEGYQACGDYDTSSHDHFLCQDLAANTVDLEMEQPWIEVLCKDGCGRWLFAMIDEALGEDSPVVLVMMKETPAQRKGDEPSFEVDGWHILENRNAPWQEIKVFKEEMHWKSDAPQE